MRLKQKIEVQIEVEDENPLKCSEDCIFWSAYHYTCSYYIVDEPDDGDGPTRRPKCLEEFGIPKTEIKIYDLVRWAEPPGDLYIALFGPGPFRVQEIHHTLRPSGQGLLVEIGIKDLTGTVRVVAEKAFSGDFE